jgi:ribosomal protein S18 acetylase RimI-like enzyme
MRPISIHSNLTAAYRETLRAILQRTASFKQADFSVALELIDIAVNKPGQSDYLFLIAEEPDGVAGYICFGSTPMTVGTYDLYWIVVDPDHQRRGIARALVEAMEDQLRKSGGRLIRVETSSQELYGAARGFYQSTGYDESARLRDFYRPGDDLIIFTKRLN